MNEQGSNGKMNEQGSNGNLITWSGIGIIVAFVILTIAALNIAFLVFTRFPDSQRDIVLVANAGFLTMALILVPVFSYGRRYERQIKDAVPPTELRLQALSEEEKRALEETARRIQ